MQAAPLVELPLDQALAASLLEQVPDGLMIADGRGLIRLVNRGFEEMFGYDRAEILGQRLELLVPEDMRIAHRGHRSRYSQSPHRRPMGVGLELRARRKDGSTFPVEISLSPVDTTEGTLTIATVRDVTERRDIESGRRWVQRLLDTTNEAILVFAPDSLMLLHANQGAATQSGYAVDELLGMTMLELLPELSEPQLRELLEPLTSNNGRTVELHAQLRRADGTQVPVEVAVEIAQPDAERRPVVVAIARDVSERLAAERALADTQQRLVVSEERERIARDLHDKVIQRLFATGLGLQAAAGQAIAEPVVQRLHTAIDDLDQAIRDIRTAIFTLHTPSVAGQDLRRSVLDKVTDAARALGFEPEVNFYGPVDAVATDERQDHLLATLQEALANVAKHAEASSARIEVRAESDVLRLVVRDDGRGIREEDAQRGGRGLGNMRRRAEALGGTADIVPAEPSGTELSWTVPLR